jgi:hypothetical protein
MTLGGRLVSLFPLAMLAAAIAALAAFAAHPNLWSALLVGAVLYLPPPIAMRIHEAYRPLQEGLTRLDGPDYSPWWAAHQFQVFYDALPFLEAALRIAPGFYSMWLRLWGSRIGYGVHWPPRLHVVDRSLMEVGNRVIFGRNVECSAHLTRRKGNELVLLVRRIRIGNSCFIGEGARIGAGATLPSGEIVPAAAVIVGEEPGIGD